MSKPLAVDIFCGTFGWSAGWLELGGWVVGFDISHEPYHGPVPRGADLVLQDVLTLDGARFREASLILCSPPCQEFSYLAMPWKRAKQIGRALRGQDVFPDGYTGSRTIPDLTALFAACFRIQREASAAAGRHIPMVVENVRGAQPWVGKAAWNFGSYYLFGDVPALMPFTLKGVKVPSMGAGWYPPDHPKHVAGLGFNTHADRATKNAGGSWFNEAHNTTSGKNQNPVEQYVASIGVDEHAGTKGYAARLGQSTISRRHGSKSNARKAASAAVAKIPAPLARFIAQTYYPK